MLHAAAPGRLSLCTSGHHPAPDALSTASLPPAPCISRVRNIAEVHTAEGNLYLFLAIDRTSKYDVARLVRKDKLAAAQFLHDLIGPWVIEEALNGETFAIYIERNSSRCPTPTPVPDLGSLSTHKIPDQQKYSGQTSDTSLRKTLMNLALRLTRPAPSSRP